MANTTRPATLLGSPTVREAASRTQKRVGKPVWAVAISGPDGVGKTTQLRLLARCSEFDDAGTLDQYDTAWHRPQMHDLAEWWFSYASIEEVIGVLARSYLARAAGHGTDSRIRLVDRGIPMLEATVAATVAAREGCGYDTAKMKALNALGPYREAMKRAERAELGVILLHDRDPMKSVAATMAREQETSQRYVVYQTVLTKYLHEQVEHGRFEETIVASGRSILSIQQELRVKLRRHGLDVPDVALEPVRIIALGGLSESGKSTAARYLQSQHGYVRLKIRHLLQRAAELRGIDDVYVLGPAEIAELLVHELNSYCAAHQFQRHVSIESLHRLDVTRELTKLLGPCLSIVYIDARSSVREKRGKDGPFDVRHRDVVKRSRGADRIRHIADHVIDNNGPLIALYHALDGIAVRDRWHRIELHRSTASSLGLPPHLTVYLERLLDRTTRRRRPLVSVLAVTGSGGRGGYQDGWSDLDVLIIAEASALRQLRRILSDLTPELNQVKLGVTLLTHTECQSGALTPRLAHTLRSIGSGELPVLWCREGLSLLLPDQESDVWASLEDGVAAAIEIRRQLLKPRPELRSLYKATALLAKVALRAEGKEYNTDKEALLALRTYLPGLDCGIVQGAQHDMRITEILATRVLDWWLGTFTGDHRLSPRQRP